MRKKNPLTETLAVHHFRITQEYSDILPELCEKTKISKTELLSFIVSMASEKYKQDDSPFFADYMEFKKKLFSRATGAVSVDSPAVATSTTGTDL